MKANAFTKILTGVMILFFSCLTLGAEEMNRAQCNQKCDTESRATCTKPEAGAPNDDTNKYNQCVRDAKQSCMEQQGCSELESTKDIKQACESAFEKYSDLAAKEKEACAAFDKTGGKSCKEKADSCQKKINNLSQPFSSTKSEETSDKDSGYGALTEVAMQSIVQYANLKNPNQTPTSSIASSGGACVKSIDRKARKDDKEKKDRERKELSDKIKSQKDDIIKYKEDLDKERNEITEKTNEVEAEAKKDILSKEKSVTEETSRVSKELVEISKRLRARSINITKKMQTLAQVNFKFQTKMLELTDEKVSIKCKQEFESFKAALVSGGAASGASPEEKAKIGALAAQYKAKGIRGSGEMKAMLIATRKACYESANSARSQAKLDNSQNVKNVQDEIDEEKNLMKDEKTSIATAQKDLENIKAQTDKEKQAGDTEKGAKLDALSKKLANQITNTDEKTKNANDKIRELTAEINNAVLIQNFEVEDAYSEAQEAIEKGINSRKRAVETCNCANQPKTHAICSKLSEDNAAYDGKKPKTTTKTKK